MVRSGAQNTQKFAQKHLKQHSYFEKNNVTHGINYNQKSAHIRLEKLIIKTTALCLMIIDYDIMSGRSTKRRPNSLKK